MLTSPGRFRVAVVAGMGIIALETIWLTRELGGAFATTVFSDLIDIPLLAVAVAACVSAGKRSSGQTRAGWTLLGVGLAAWGAGQLTWAYYELLRGVEVPFPSLADVGYLGLIPFTAWGMLRLPAAPRSRAGRTRALLDGLIIATSLFALSWALVLGPLYQSESASVVEKALGLAYPFGDILLIGVVLFVAARASRAERATISLIGSGLVVLALADSVFTYLTINDTYVTGNLVDVGWTAGFVLIGLGALRAGPAQPEHRERPTSRFIAVLPYTAVILGVPVAAWQFASHGTLDPVVFAVGVALFAVVSARQLLIVTENATLARWLDAKVKERTAELEGTLSQLAEARRLQDEFVSNATHELRTPLTIMIGALDTLSRPVDAIWQDAPMLIEMARKGAQRMNQLVDDLLLASGITDTFGSPRAPFDVSEHVHFAMLSFEPTEKAVQTHLQPAVRALGDSGRLQEALGHLLRNADKFGPPGSTIFVDVRPSGDNISVVVRDEGPGIPAHLREAVFERFYQADGSDTRRHGGMGLGLYLARGVVKMMGGEVSIDDVRRGCAVRITLPAARPDQRSGSVVDDDVKSRVRGAQSRFDASRRGA